MEVWDDDGDEELWDFDDEEASSFDAADDLAALFFLNHDGLFPDDGEAYILGLLEADDWEPLVGQLEEVVDLDAIVELADELSNLIELPGLPTELLEYPLDFLGCVLEGRLPPQASGKKLGSRRLLKIAQGVLEIARDLPDTAQAAVRAWASVHRALLEREEAEAESEVDDLPAAVTGFTMLTGMSLINWPERAQGQELPAELRDPNRYDELLGQWETLPDSPSVTEEGVGAAEALFAQGQLAHTLARLGSVEGDGTDHLEKEDLALLYSRLSRSILWVHNQCRHCPQRAGVTCLVAAAEHEERPSPLLDVAADIANKGRIEGCIRM